mgnify:FL=1
MRRGFEIRERIEKKRDTRAQISNDQHNHSQFKHDTSYTMTTAHERPDRVWFSVIDAMADY